MIVQKVTCRYPLPSAVLPSSARRPITEFRRPDYLKHILRAASEFSQLVSAGAGTSGPLYPVYHLAIATQLRGQGGCAPAEVCP